MDRHAWLLFFSGLYCAAVVTANILATKLFALPFGLAAPGGVFAFAVTFLLGDVVNEIWGPQRASQLVWFGFIAALLSLAISELVRVLPPAPAWPHQEAYEAVLGSVPRIVLASIVAYLVSQLHDVWAFDWWRRLTAGRHLWLRNNASTIVSQLLDSAVFIGVAFAGVLPPATLASVALAQYLVKFVLALADTPFIYALVYLVRRVAPETRAGD